MIQSKCIQRFLDYACCFSGEPIVDPFQNVGLLRNKVAQWAINLDFIAAKLPDMQPKKDDPLVHFRRQVRELIRKQYPTVEKFCFEEDFQKSSLSRLLSGKRTEFKIATLMKIARALGKKLVIRLE